MQQGEKKTVDKSKVLKNRLFRVFLATGYMKCFIAKRVNPMLVNLRYVRFKLLKYKENNKKMCNTLNLIITSKVFLYLERYYLFCII